jgi:hypothetical protein
MTTAVPARYRRACRYEAYVPDRLMDLALDVGLDLAGLIAEAESSIRALNQGARPDIAITPLSPMSPFFHGSTEKERCQVISPRID